MASPDLSLSPACRILVVSGDTSQNREFVGHIQAITSTSLTPHPSDGSFIEWTIKNKYYTAPVHMLLHETSKLPAKPLWPPESDGERVPALIFVFKKGDAYQDVFLSMREAYVAHDPEVALAVGLQASNPSNTPASTETIEEFFSDHNFEYVDSEDKSHHIDDEGPQYDVSGLPRVLEALNMIMWPSMIRTPQGGLRRTAVAEDNDDEDTFDQSFVTVSDTVPPDNLSLFDSESRPSAQSLRELDVWLDNDDSWVPPETAPSGPEAPEAGFEDDFSDFLSAPPTSDQDIPSSAAVRATAARIFDSQDADQDTLRGFDLSSVLGNLEAMRAAISEITDMEERRTAAARVALGLAMGLGLDEEDEPDEELLRELHELKNA